MAHTQPFEMGMFSVLLSGRNCWASCLVHGSFVECCVGNCCQLSWVCSWQLVSFPLTVGSSVFTASSQ